MADVDAWMPLWIGDYLADTQDLTTEEHGAYMYLLMAAWRNGGRLPFDADKLARISKLGTKAWASTWRSLARFFVIVDAEIVQKRLVQELAAATKGRAAASDRGKKGAAARYSSTAQAMPKHEPSTTQAVLKYSSSPSPSESESGGDPDRAPRRFWSPDDWCREFGRAWTTKYGKFYGQSGDAKACGSLANLFDKLPPGERLRSQERAGEMIAEFLAKTTPGVLERKHPFAFFVGDFGALGISTPTKSRHDPILDASIARTGGQPYLPPPREATNGPR